MKRLAILGTGVTLRGGEDPRERVTGFRSVNHLQDTHFDARGNDSVGKAMANFICKHFSKVIELH